MIDNGAYQRGATNVPVDCSGITFAGRKCHRWQWFPSDNKPETWRCHDHRPDPEPGDSVS